MPASGENDTSYSITFIYYQCTVRYAEKSLLTSKATCPQVRWIAELGWHTSTHPRSLNRVPPSGTCSVVPNLFNQSDYIKLTYISFSFVAPFTLKNVLVCIIDYKLPWSSLSFQSYFQLICKHTQVFWFCLFSVLQSCPVHLQYHYPVPAISPLGVGSNLWLVFLNLQRQGAFSSSLWLRICCVDWP